MSFAHGIAQLHMFAGDGNKMTGLGGVERSIACSQYYVIGMCLGG